MKNRLLNIDGVINFRDLGGYQGFDGKTVAWGTLYRAAQLDRISAEGVRQMTTLNIGTVVDLRFSDEETLYPTVREAFPHADFISWESELNDAQKQSSGKIKRSWRESLESGDVHQVREAMRTNYPVKLYSHRGVYRELLLRAAYQQSPLVFHCAAGKDRTGVAAALILGLLGVSRDDIVKDYLISQSQIGNLLDTWVGGGATSDHRYDDFQRRLAEYPRDLVQPVFEADISYIETLLEYVDKTHQTFAGYAQNVLELSQAQLDRLRMNLLV